MKPNFADILIRCLLPAPASKIRHRDGEGRPRGSAAEYPALGSGRRREKGFELELGVARVAVLARGQDQVSRVIAQGVNDGG